MCGIFFSLSSKSTIPTQETKTLLEKRGPDSIQTHTVCRTVQTEDGSSTPVTLYLTFISTVLSLRDDHVHSQPLVDLNTSSVLCWNGEAWKINGESFDGNDTELVFDLFLRAVRGDRENAAHRLAEAVANISGPFAFVFYDAAHSRIFFSRDCLGRRSLLQGFDDDGSLKVCSLCDSSSVTCFEEVGFSGAYMIDLDMPLDAYNQRHPIETLPWTSDSTPPAGHIVSQQAQNQKS